MIVITESVIGYTHSYVLTDSFATLPLLYKLAIILSFGNIYAKCRYYGGLKAAELAVISSGLSYHDHRGDYSRIVISDIAKVELNHNPKEIANYWNFSIAYWLKIHIYNRA